MMARWILLLLFSISPLHLTAWAQDLDTQDRLRELLDISKRRSLLLSDGTAPFHLVASYEQFDLSGNVSGRGSLDEIWENPRRYRQLLTVPEIEEVTSSGATTFKQNLESPARQLLEIDNGKQLWRTGQWILFGDILTPLLHPLASISQSGSRLSIQPVPPGNKGLECIGWEPELEGVPKESQVALTTVCLASGNHLLKLVSNPNGREIVFDDIQLFGGKYLARSINIFSKAKLVAKIRVDVLEAANANDLKTLDVAPPPTAQLIAYHRADLPFTTGELMQGQLLTKINPHYPEAGLKGAIVVKFRVNTSGEVESEDVIKAEGQLLKAPVLTALRAWRFRVSYQGSKPIAVDHVYRFSFGGDEKLQ